jgi:hypothetical protein
MMPLGSVIIKIESTTKADTMWYFPLLEPYDWRTSSGIGGSGDHISVRSDLSDLGDAILWAKAHDKECETIVTNAKTLYNKFIAQDGQLDYLQVLCWEVASRFTCRSSPSLKLTSGTTSSSSSPAILAPSLAVSPGYNGDWFSESNADYCAAGLGPLTMATAPFVRDLACVSCGCPSCELKKTNIETLRAAGEKEKASAASDAASAAEILRLAVEKRNAVISAAARTPAPVVAFKDLTKARAAAERAAAAAAARKLAEGSGASGAGGAGGGVTRR